METVVSGIRPTGNLHFGNYFGAIKNFLRMQEENNCYFFIADYHSLTTHPTPEDLHGNVKQVLAEYLAAGLDPEKATIYIQSDVPEITELYLLLNMNAYLGELQRVTSFKEKARKQPNNVNAGLLTYPTLMAADVIIHKASKVPVGKDQEQNLEMIRTFARRFNRMYNKEHFPIPEPYNFGEALIKIPGLDGTGKMGKSEGVGNALFLADDAKTIKKKVMKAKTDSGPTEMNQQKPDYIENLFKLVSVVSDDETYNHFDELYNSCQIRYGDLKKKLAEDMTAFINPLRERIEAIKQDESYLSKIVTEGAEKARENAAKTVKETRKIIGIRHF